jgi:hypothetical protein
MRIIKEIAHPHYRTTIFQWNNKYIIKLETPMLEQTFKIDQYEVTSDDEILQLLDAEFLQQAMKRFESMAGDVALAMKRLQL